MFVYVRSDEPVDLPSMFFLIMKVLVFSAICKTTSDILIKEMFMYIFVGHIRTYLKAEHGCGLS